MLKPNFAPESATHGQRSVLHNGGAVFKGHPSGTQARVSNKQHFFSQNISAMSYEYWIKGFMRCYFIFKKITHPHFTVRHLSFETMLHIQGRLELADVCLTCFIVQDAEGELVLLWQLYSTKARIFTNACSVWGKLIQRFAKLTSACGPRYRFLQLCKVSNNHREKPRH